MRRIAAATAIASFITVQPILSQGYDTHLLIAGHENFVALRNDTRHIYEKAMGEILVRHDSVFIIPAGPYWLTSGNIAYVSVPFDSIFFRWDGPRYRPDDCSHCIDSLSMQRCLGWQDTLERWQRKYPGYELTYTLLALIHAPVASYTVIRGYTLTAFDQDSVFYSLSFSSGSFAREFGLLCLQRDPCRVRIEISGISLGLMGCSRPLFRYPRTLLLGLRMSRF